MPPSAVIAESVLVSIPVHIFTSPENVAAAYPIYDEAATMLPKTSVAELVYTANFIASSGTPPTSEPPPSTISVPFSLKMWPTPEPNSTAGVHALVETMASDKTLAFVDAHVLLNRCLGTMQLQLLVHLFC